MLDYEALLKNNKSAKFYWIYKHFNILKQYCVLYIYLLENIHIFNIWIFSSKFLDEISIFKYSFENVDWKILYRFVADWW